MRPSRQRGVALITVLLIMALALLLTGSLLRSHRLTLQGTAQHIHQVQLRQWAITAEGWAAQRLEDASPATATNANLAQAWAQRPLPLTLPGVELRVEIEDLAGRFNLAPLLAPGRADDVALGRWRRLLERLDIAAIDLTPLRGREVRDTSQLRLLPGVDESSLRRLEPWVALLPVEARLNVNTAGARVLSTLEGMTESDARGLIQLRPAEGYPDAVTFALVSGLNGRGMSAQGLAVGSRWFRVSAEVAAGRSRLRLVSDLELDPKTRRAHVIQRRFLAPTQGEPFL